MCVRRFIDKSKKQVVATCRYRHGEEVVKSGLALTPSQMMKMSEHGIPVSAQLNDSLFYDGTENPTWDVPLDLARGIDVAELWAENKSIRAKFKKAHVNDVQKYD